MPDPDHELGRLYSKHIEHCLVGVDVLPSPPSLRHRDPSTIKSVRGLLCPMRARMTWSTALGGGSGRSITTTTRALGFRVLLDPNGGPDARPNAEERDDVAVAERPPLARSSSSVAFGAAARHSVMSLRQYDTLAGCFWYPYHPRLRWPIRLLGAVGILAVVMKLVIHQRWSEVSGLFGPLSLFLVSFDTPEPRLKTATYLVGAALASLAVAFTVLVIGLWILAR